MKADKPLRAYRYEPSDQAEKKQYMYMFEYQVHIYT